MRQVVQRIYRERKALMASLKVRRVKARDRSLLTSRIGRWFSSSQAGCSPGLRCTSFHRIRLFAHLQSKRYVGLASASRNHHPWILIHLRPLCPIAVRIRKVFHES